MRPFIKLASVLLCSGALFAHWPSHGAETLSRTVTDLSSYGAFAVDVIEFADLADASRAGRKVPIKVHVPSTGGPYPVVVVSHGGGGHWDANYAQVQQLASHGYAVLALEHVGSNTEVMKRSLRIVANLEAMTRDVVNRLDAAVGIAFASLP